MLRTVAALAVLSVMLGGCGTGARRVASVSVMPPPPLPDPGWRGLASAADQLRIDGLAGQWQQALGAIPKARQALVTGEGALLDPKGALEAPDLTPGSYRCRLVRLGGPRGIASFKPDFCYVDGTADKKSFTKQTGENLPGGWLYSDGAKRQVFLGTLRGRDVTIAPAYGGGQPAKDVVAVLERVAPFRWRMVVPRTDNGTLDIYELVPVVTDTQAPAKKAG